MEVLHARCAGIDIGKKSAKVCVRVQGSGSRKTTNEVIDCGSMTREILQLRQYLVAERVTCIVMEATSDYWKPYYFLLEELTSEGVELILANARAVKNVPGRKTDVNDATWLADLAAHGLVRASFVPPPPIRELRDLTRTRTIVARERVREMTRLEKRLESPGIKLSVVVSDLDGVSARRMLDALVAGERDPLVLANLAVPQMYRKHEQLVDALTGRFSDHDAFMIGLHLQRIDELAATITTLDDRIEEAIAPFRLARDLLCTSPGVSTVVADIIIAETGGDMSVFPTADHLASWAGVAPGQHQSAARKTNAKTRPGRLLPQGRSGYRINVDRPQQRPHPHCRPLPTPAITPRLQSRPRRHRTRNPRRRLALLTTHTDYHDLGENHYQHAHAQQATRRAVHQLKQLGYQVHLEKAS